VERPRSKALHERAAALLPGGVDSPVRAFPPYPSYIVRAKGSRMWDADGHELVDHCLGFGPLILGHAHPAVVRAVQEQAERGTLYGAPSELEVQLAERVCRHYRAMERVRFVSSGTEATMHAIRLARGATGRRYIVKMEGCFHGAHDAVLVRAGSGAMAHSAPDSAGVLDEVASRTLLAPYNDADAVRRLLGQHRGDVAAVILEPVMANVGPVAPRDGYLQQLREMTSEEGVLLIFDEVVTGFRLGLGGASAHFGVRPDIATLGKVLGGGLPVGAFGASQEVMDNLSPLGKVYQAGTFAGNPLSMAAGLAALKELERVGHDELDRRGAALRSGLSRLVDELRLPYQVAGLGSMFQLFMADRPVVDYRTALASDAGRFQRLFHALLERGVYVPPSQFETCFLSTAHDDRDVRTTLDAYAGALEALQ